ncbi:MAG: rhodanese-like domain-containing protein [Candidatus Obscuribacter sp.]|nr:rhodanese-like domain-containing protein [Candidatus Obscuribacter sp.]MBK9201157.1 rhodanese-like domain-containing protein [Candidatus Obscuribacter sp.]MBK9621820.1 rhodanese-like domain-containing protein [Candidatus Obscuribacter sp.]
MSDRPGLTLPEIAAKDLSVLSSKTLIDVRSPIEYEVEHIDGAINIPLDKLETRISEVPRQGELVVICRSGKRAERGAYTLAGQGFNPKVLSGGMLAWREAKLPVIEGKKMLPIERQIQLVVGLGVLTGVLLGVLVDRWFLLIPAFFGAGLTFAGLSGTCALGILLGKAPWNQLPGTGKNCCQ